ncbi:MAG: ATP synthase F1 subunit delta, partial [Dolichospermum sp.]
MKSNAAAAEISQPYAVALLSIAQSQNLTEEIGTDVRTFLGLLTDSQELNNFLANPFVKPENKKNLLKQLLGDVSPYLRNFLLLLVDRRRIAFSETIL